MNRSQLQNYLNDFLDVDQIKDYCPNGLQIEGKEEIKKIMTGVTACQALLDAAVAQKVDAVLVHHGYFWKGELAALTGIKRQRIKTLLEHDINLFAYHLPLDVHAVIGNNVQLARQLEFCDVVQFDQGDGVQLGFKGCLSDSQSPQSLQCFLSEQLQHSVQHISGGKKQIRTIGWCTGATQDLIELAASHQLDAFISGEVSERTTHLARELGIDYFCAGHHATERYGIQALGQHLAEKFDLTCQFIDIPNPV